MEVQLRGVRLERLRDFGDVWLALGLWRLLGLDTLLGAKMPAGRAEVPWATVAAILTLARFCAACSELHLEDHWYARTALEDLLGVPAEKVHTDRLYAGLDRLLEHKESVEKHLQERLGDLFDLKYELLLYDVTSAYFEGRCEANPMAQRGYSRDSRPDCLQVCIGLVVTEDGMPRGHEVFDGNTHDSKTLETIVQAMHQRFRERLEAALQKMQQSAATGRRKDLALAQRRWGRLQQRHWRAARTFTVQMTPLDPPGVNAKIEITYSHTTPWDDWTALSEGCYLLRTNLTGIDAPTLWKRYIQLTEAEWAFRITKDELVIRPIWHQKADRVKAHILVCFLAYGLGKTLGQWMQRSGLGEAPRTLLLELAKIKSGDAAEGAGVAEH
jgi:hypothetical protein